MVARKKKRIISVDSAFLGDEPISGSLDGSKLIRAYNWYNQMYGVKDSRKWLVDYMKNSDYETTAIDNVKSLDDKDISHTVASTARMLSNGVNLPGDVVTRFEKKLDEYAVKVSKKREEKKTEPGYVKTKKKSPMELIELRVKNEIAEIDGVIDDFVRNKYKSDFNMYEYLQRSDMKGVHAKKLADYFNPLFEELSAAINKSDGDVVEAYDNLKKSELNRYYEFVRSIVEDATMFQKNANKKRTRKIVRKPKMKSAVDITKRVKCKKEDSSLKLVSINPAEIVGAKSLWTYNTKTRQLTVYHTNDTGLSVKGTTIINYDDKTSVRKKLRENRADAVLNEVVLGGRVALRKIMDDITTKPAVLNGRINKDTLLLRAVK